MRKIVPGINLAPERNRLAGDAAEDGARNLSENRPNLIRRGLTGLCGPVPQRDVADFVREHAGNFALVLCCLQHPAVDVHRTAGQRERIQVADIDDVERVAELRMPKLARYRLSQALPYALHIAVDAIVAKHWKLLRHLLCRLAAEL